MTATAIFPQETLIWVPLEQRYAQILAGRNITLLDEQTRMQIRVQANRGWGLEPSGYTRLGLTTTPTPDMLASMPGFALSTAWAHPETHTLVEDVHTRDSTRTVHNYQVHVYQPDPLDAPAFAVISLVVARRNIQTRRPGNYSPLYDPATGETVNLPTMYTRSGEILWTTPTSTPAEFTTALNQAHAWLTNREQCDALTAITPQYPNQ